MDVMAELRAATREPHARIESALGIMDPALDLPRYVSILQRFLGFYEPVESLLAQCPSLARAVPDLPHRRKAPRLREDLGVLAPGTPVRHCRSVPRLDTLPRGLGALYVLEGATLGGQVISRHVRQRLGLDASGGAAFFSGYGERTGGMWRGMQSILRENLESVADLREAACAAQEVFVALERWSSADRQDLSPVWRAQGTRLPAAF